MVIAGPGDGCRVGAGFEMPRSVVSELLDRRGVDAGFERHVVSCPDFWIVAKRGESVMVH